MTKYFFTLACAISCTTTAWATHPLPLPESSAGNLILEAESAPKNIPQADATILYSASAKTDASRMDQNDEARIITHDKYQSSEITLNYQLPNDQFAAQYRIHTAFALGGVAPQTFTIFAGPDSDHLQSRTTFTQTNDKSWHMQWREAAATLMLYPGDKVLQIQTSGKASGKKIIDAFLLTKIMDLPSDMTPQSGQLRVRLSSESAEAKQRILVLEAEKSTPADIIYTTIEKSQRTQATSIQPIFGKQATELASAINIQQLPALVITDHAWTLRGVLEHPTDANTIASFLSSPTIPDTIANQPTPTKVQQLANGIAPQWSTIGTWSGPGGLTLWGLDWEQRIRPSASDPEIVTAFDTVEAARWTLSDSDPAGRVILDSSTRDLTWSRGSSYACLYVRSANQQQVNLHLSHNGQEMKLWLDDRELPLTNDPKSPIALTQNHQTDATITITDQGNPIEVKLGKMQSPQKSELTLSPGWHRILVKFVMQHAKNEKSIFAAAFTNASGKPATLETSSCAPESTLPAHASLRDLVALISSNSPFNLISPNKNITLNVNIARPMDVREDGRRARHGSLGLLFAGNPPTPVRPVATKLRTVIKNYDQKIIRDITTDCILPGKIAFDIGRMPENGFYSIELTALSSDGRILRQFPPDGLNVIGGTAAQFARRDQKKMAVTYYFMGSQYRDLFFPYMQRIGIYRNVGGNNGRILDMYQTAHQLGLELAVDFWNRDAEYNRQFIQETSPFVNFYKSFNEIDIRPDQRGTPEFWVEKSRREFNMVKQMDPGAIVLGGSLVRVGNDPWFRKCLELGLEDTLDAWDVHCYPQQAPELEGHLANSSVESELGVINALAKLNRSTTKPFWVGETGARASHGMDARRWQADMVTKMTAWAQSRSNVPVIGFLIPWDYSRQEGVMNDICAGHMPAESAYFTASALIDGFKYKRIDTSSNIQAAQYGPTILAWSTTATETLQVPVQAGTEYALVDVVGRVRSIRATTTHIRLNLSTSPLYLLPMSDYHRLTAEQSAQTLFSN